MNIPARATTGVYAAAAIFARSTPQKPATVVRQNAMHDRMHDWPGIREALPHFHPRHRGFVDNFARKCTKMHDFLRRLQQEFNILYLSAVNRLLSFALS
jgi:hypothetical protein